MVLACLKHPALEVDIKRQGQTDNTPRSREEDVDGDRVPLQRPMRERVQSRLDDVGNTRGAGDGAVDTAEGAKAKDFGNEVTR